MAAAAAAVAAGLRVEIFEARRTLGGRAGSFRDPAGGRLVDLCQHVAMGCCTNLADFCRRIGVEDCFRNQRRLLFIGPAGRRHPLSATPLLPAPLHLAAGFARLGYLSWPDRRRIARTLLKLARLQSARGDDRKSIGDWLRGQGESETAIERFWSVVLLSALGETLDRASLALSRKVFVDGFLANRRSYEMVVPQLPLQEIFDRRGGARLAEQGIAVHRGTKVRRLEGDSRQAEAIVLADGSRRPCDFVVLAVPWWQIRPLLPPSMLDAIPALAGIERIEPAPITAVHLWLDRPLAALPNAALVGRLSQWVFRPAWMLDPPVAVREHYCQAVISASHGLVGRPHDEVARQVFDDLTATGLAARDAKLLRHRVATSRRAVFSARPGINRLRPAQTTPAGNLMLSGDWTATGWPATMESAVRSGYLAVEAILAKLGRPQRLLVADLARGRLARRLIADG
jgi:squalene-associated FAD-dependent desaturase